MCRVVSYQGLFDVSESFYYHFIWSFSFFWLITLIKTENIFQVFWSYSLVDRNGYPYFHRNFVEYDRIRTVISLWQSLISAPDITAIYGPFMCRKVTVNGRTWTVSFHLGLFFTAIWSVSILIIGTSIFTDHNFRLFCFFYDSLVWINTFHVWLCDQLCRGVPSGGGGGGVG
jgi:hypothetical protein